MSELAIKLKENVLSGLYTEHSKGIDLLLLDIQAVFEELNHNLETIQTNNEVLLNNVSELRVRNEELVAENKQLLEHIELLND